MKRLLGSLTFWRSVCSCFSITSSWYTLPVRSSGGPSLERQGAGSGSRPTAGRSPGYRLPLVPEALGSPFLAGVPRDAWRRRPRSTWRGHVCGCGCGSWEHQACRVCIPPEDGPCVCFWERLLPRMTTSGGTVQRTPPPRPSTEPPAGPSIAPAHGACKWANGRESLPGGQDQ